MLFFLHHQQLVFKNKTGHWMMMMNLRFPTFDTFSIQVEIMNEAFQSNPAEDYPVIYSENRYLV